MTTNALAKAFKKAFVREAASSRVTDGQLRGNEVVFSRLMGMIRAGM